MMEETFKIRLYIADEEFSVSVPRNDEAAEKLHRDAAKRVNGLMNEYLEAFGGSPSGIETKRLLAMVALHLAKQTLQDESQKDDSRCLALMEGLDKELEDFLAR